MKVTGFSKTAINLGYPILDTSDDKVLASIKALLRKRNLNGTDSFGKFQLENSITYGHYDETGKLVTVLTITTAFLGSPFSVVVSVDWIASLDTKDHSATKMIHKLKRYVARRRKSWLVTQCLQRNDAQNFWKGKLTSSTWASVLIGLIHIYDNDFKIYESCDNMVS